MVPEPGSAIDPLANRDIPAYHWPGLFTSDRLHRVEVDNAARLVMNRICYGVADCGAVCLPMSAHAFPDRPLCRRCFASPEQHLTVS